MSFRSRSKNRSFKAGVTASGNRKKREEMAISLRNKRKEETLMAERRRMPEMSSAGNTQIEAIKKKTADPAMFEQYLQAVWSDNDGMLQYEAVVMLRKLLSAQDNPPINRVIESAVCKKLLLLMQNFDNHHMQYECAWALTNVCSGTAEQTNHIVELQGIQQFIKLLESPHVELVDQAVWALANIAGDCTELRDLVISCDCVQALCKVAKRHVARSTDKNVTTLMENVTWAFSNMVRGKPQPDWEQVKDCLPILVGLMRTYPYNKTLLADACWALSHCSDDSDDEGKKIGVIVAAGAVEHLIACAKSSEKKIISPALRALGNIVTGNDEETQTVLDLKGMVVFRELCSHPLKSIRKEACWSISNVAAGTKHQIQAILEHQVLQVLMERVMQDQYEVAKEATWAMSNMVSGGSFKQRQYLIDCGVAQAMVHMLSCQDQDVLGIAIDTMQSLCNVGRTLADNDDGGDNSVTQLIEACEGVNALEDIQDKVNEENYHKICKLLTDHWDVDDGNDENQGQVNNAFTFQMPTASKQQPFSFDPSAAKFGQQQNTNQQAPFGSGASNNNLVQFKPFSQQQQQQQTSSSASSFTFSAPATASGGNTFTFAPPPSLR
jgi:importin subunit alpha-1